MTIEQAEQIRYWSCGRKRTHDSRGHAEFEAQNARPARAYKCCFCAGWHVGRAATMRTLRRNARAIRVLSQRVPI